MLDRLTLDQLRVLVAVAETGSFSAAARRLGRVQSAISQTVQSLESDLGIAVFERAGKTPKLSDAGRVILTIAISCAGRTPCGRGPRASPPTSSRSSPSPSTPSFRARS
jgi:predicted transcriptional regulator